MAVFTGIGLAAASGFRVFVPLFLVSLAANTGIDLPMIPDETLQGMLGSGFSWLGNDLVTVALGIATAVEVGGFYIPWLDNLLDTVASPAAVLAGILMSGAVMPETFGDGALKWLVAIVAGGGTAGLVQSASVITRGTSSATTGGLGNPLVSTMELAGSVITTFLAIIAPLIVILLVIVLFVLAFRAISRFRKKRREKRLRGAEPGDTS